MVNSGDTKTPWSFWAIAVLAVLFNLGGAISYSLTKFKMLDPTQFTAVELAYLYDVPAWGSAVWALGVWGAFLGSIFLLLRNKLSVPLFGIAIFGLVVFTYYQRFFNELPESMQTTGQNLFAAAIWIVTIALFIYSRRLRDAGKFNRAPDVLEPVI